MDQQKELKIIKKKNTESCPFCILLFFLVISKGTRQGLDEKSIFVFDCMEQFYA